MIGVIGVGSPFGADNIAEQVITLLKQNLQQTNFKNKIKLEYFDRPGLYLLEYIKAFKKLHLIDAIVSQKPIGTIHRYDDISLLQNQNSNLSSHDIGIAEVLLLGKILNGLPEKIIIHGIEIAKETKQLIPDPIIKAVNTLTKQITKELTKNPP